MCISRHRVLSVFCVLALGLSANSLAGVMDVINVSDGGLSDWGLFLSTVNDRQSWTPNGNGVNSGNYTYTDNGSYTYNGITIYYSVEDYIRSGSGYIGPGYGGQAYDAEALYVTWDDYNLYIALVTGHNPNTKDSPSESDPRYAAAAGDFALNFWEGTNTGSYEFGIRTPHQQTMTNGTNIVTGYSATVYRTSEAGDWRTDPLWGTSTVTSLEMSNLSGPSDVAGTATMTIQQLPNTLNIGAGPKTDNHWFYEISVPKSVFGDVLAQNSFLDISWTMNCANDVILLNDDLPTVDEPPAWALLSLTLPFVVYRRRRDNRSIS